MPLDERAPLPKIIYGDHESESWREALSAIAAELQRFFTTTISNENGGNNAVTPQNKLELTALEIKLRTQLKSRIQEISGLKSDIRKACIVAKEIISAKECDNKSLQTLLKRANKDVIELHEQIEMGNDMIKKLSVENQVLSDKLDNLTNFISLGYRELLNLNGEAAENIPVTLELRKIIVSCGQYYADYYNELQKSGHYAQRNIFLLNKVRNMEGVLETNLRELDDIRNTNCRLQNDNKILNNKIRRCMENNENRPGGDSLSQVHIVDKDVDDALSSIQRDITYIKDELSDINHKFNYIPNVSKKIKLVSTENTSRSELQKHVSLVSNLLRDQDFMLQELKKVSLELLPASKFHKIVHHNNENNESHRLQIGTPNTFINTSAINFKTFRSFPENEDIDPNSNADTSSNQIHSLKWSQRTNDFIRLSSNSQTMVIYKKKDINDEKSTLCGITSEMQNIMDGSVATKVKAFETYSSEEFVSKKSSNVKHR